MDEIAFHRPLAEKRALFTRSTRYCIRHPVEMEFVINRDLSLSTNNREICLRFILRKHEEN